MYKIVDTHKKVTVATGFSKREDAKPTRNKLNIEAKVEVKKDAKPRFVVSRDDLHPRGATDGFDHTNKRPRWV